LPPSSPASVVPTFSLPTFAIWTPQRFASNLPTTCAFRPHPFEQKTRLDMALILWQFSPRELISACAEASATPPTKVPLKLQKKFILIEPDIVTCIRVFSRSAALSTAIVWRVSSSRRTSFFQCHVVRNALQATRMAFSVVLILFDQEKRPIEEREPSAMEATIPRKTPAFWPIPSASSEQQA